MTMIYMLGKPGTGKTRYLTHRFFEHITDNGGAYFDFTGDVTRILSAIPKDRIDDVVLFDPLNPDPIGLNVIHHPENIPRTATAVLETIKSAWHYEGSTPLLDMYTYNAVAALAETDNGTLLGVPYLILSDGYRKHVMSRVRDPILRHFWNDFYPAIPERDRRHDTMSTLNKFYALITDPTIRNIIGQVRTSFTITDNSIVIATFHPQLGKEKVSFLSTLLLHHLPDMFTILDGGHNLGPRAVLEKRNIIFSHQYLAQLTESMRETLIGTAEEMLCFRIGPLDNQRLEMEFDINRVCSTLTELRPGRYHRKGKTVDHDLPVPEDYMPQNDPQRVINASNSHNTCRRSDVEQDVVHFLYATGILRSAHDLAAYS